jgi:folylpolyglutamate synthase/dihydropteroate synthase
LQAALAKAGQHPQHPLVITGSFYLVGEVLRTLEGSST